MISKIQKSDNVNFICWKNQKKDLKKIGLQKINKQRTKIYSKNLKHLDLNQKNKLKII